MDKQPYIRPTKVYQSRGAPTGAATKPLQPIKYTGEAVLGTATMHKSNGVPVFSKESIVEINTMRRG